MPTADEDMRYPRWLAALWPSEPIDAAMFLQCADGEMMEATGEVLAKFKRFWRERGASGEALDGAQRRKVIDALVLERLGHFTPSLAPPGWDEAPDAARDAYEARLLALPDSELADECRRSLDSDANSADFHNQVRGIISSRASALAKRRSPYAPALSAAAKALRSQGLTLKQALRSLTDAPYIHGEWIVSVTVEKTDGGNGNEKILIMAHGTTYTVTTRQFQNSYWVNAGR